MDSDSTICPNSVGSMNGTVLKVGDVVSSSEEVVIAYVLEEEEGTLQGIFSQ